VCFYGNGAAAAFEITAFYTSRYRPREYLFLWHKGKLILIKRKCLFLAHSLPFNATNSPFKIFGDSLLQASSFFKVAVTGVLQANGLEDK
jgi:hypothetical protein